MTDGAEEQAPAEKSAGRPLRRGGPGGGDTALAALQEEARRRLPTADLLDRVAVRARRP